MFEKIKELATWVIPTKRVKCDQCKGSGVMASPVFGWGHRVWFVWCVGLMAAGTLFDPLGFCFAIGFSVVYVGMLLTVISVCVNQEKVVRELN